MLQIKVTLTTIIFSKCGVTQCTSAVVSSLCNILFSNNRTPHWFIPYTYVITYFHIQLQECAYSCNLYTALLHIFVLFLCLLSGVQIAMLMPMQELAQHCFIILTYYPSPSPLFYRRNNECQQWQGVGGGALPAFFLQ